MNLQSSRGKTPKQINVCWTWYSCRTSIRSSCMRVMRHACVRIRLKFLICSIFLGCCQSSLWKLSWSPTTVHQKTEIDIPENACLASQKLSSALLRWYPPQEPSPQGSPCTSRPCALGSNADLYSFELLVFHCFCPSLIVILGHLIWPALWFPPAVPQGLFCSWREQPTSNFPPSTAGVQHPTTWHLWLLWKWT